jgi:hypothetical protein
MLRLSFNLPLSLSPLLLQVQPQADLRQILLIVIRNCSQLWALRLRVRPRRVRRVVGRGKRTMTLILRRQIRRKEPRQRSRSLLILEASPYLAYVHHIYIDTVKVIEHQAHRRLPMPPHLIIANVLAFLAHRLQRPSLN